MILRSIPVRHVGRRILTSPIRTSWTRSLSTETEIQEPGIISQLKGAPIQTETDLLQSHANLSSPLSESITTVAEDHHILNHIKKRTAKLGSIVAQHYEPNDVIINPPSIGDVTLERLMASQSHLGHSTSLWNPANQRYIHGIRQGIHIISLEATAAHLRRAAKVVEGVAYHGGLILFVGTRPDQDRCIIRAAELAQACHLFGHWTPGTITNGDQILSQCSVKTVNEFDENVPGYEAKMENWKSLKPDLVVVMNPLENYVLLHECGMYNIPTIGIIDTDADPTWVTYPIPANDDSLRCVQLIAGVLGRAGQEGQTKRSEAARSGRVTWEPPVDLGRPERDSKKDANSSITERPKVAALEDEEL